MATYSALLKKVILGSDLTEEESQSMIASLFKGEYTDAQTAGLLAALATKGESVSEVIGSARAMREAGVHLACPYEDAVDTVGTGGDGGISFNVSTTVAFVAAGAGARVVKHGNRASSGKSGAADCLEALGVNLKATVPTMEKALRDIGFCFLFAPAFHPAMRYAGPIRKQLGVRTIFNMLGPLANPAGARHQLIGVYKPELTEVFAQVLQKLGSVHVLSVHGSDGMDEITLTGKTRCTELKNGEFKTFDIDPKEFFGAYATSADLEGGMAADNAAITRGILDGSLRGPKRDIVLINSAASLVAADLATDLADGIAKSAAAIDGGAALAKLDAFVALTNTDPK